MILSRLRLNDSRRARLWASNPYRVHQRLMMACEGDPRVLFRVEDDAQDSRRAETLLILVQTSLAPDWHTAFGAFPVLAHEPEWKRFEPNLQPGTSYRFRLLANPVVCRNGQRLGLLREAEQRAWLDGKLGAAGAEVLSVEVRDCGLRRSRKGDTVQTHQSVRFEGGLHCRDPERLLNAIRRGIGPAKGYGYGLLSLARLG